MIRRSAILASVCTITEAVRPNIIPLAHIYLIGIWSAIGLLEHAGVELYYRLEKFRSIIMSPQVQYTALGFFFVVDFVFFMRPGDWNKAFIYFAF